VWRRFAITLQKETHVTRILAIATLVAVGIAGPALAQTKSARAHMNEMKTKYGQTFDQCQAIATSRGFNIRDMGDNDSEMVNAVMFIEGCIMGKQR
jgi:hypothetical protein